MALQEAVSSTACGDAGANPLLSFAKGLSGVSATARVASPLDVVSDEVPLAIEQHLGLPAAASSSAGQPAYATDISTMHAMADAELTTSLDALNLTEQELRNMEHEFAQFEHQYGANFGLDSGDAEQAFDDGSVLQNTTNWAHSFWASHQQPKHQSTYRFRDENPLLATPADAKSTFDAGVKLFNQGRLTESVLALEAAVQKGDSNINRSDAWRWLGAAHAENDEDPLAIMCLERAEQEDGENLEALLELGVSKTNELAQNEALNHLEQWLARHPDYAEIPARFGASPQRDSTGLSVFQPFHERVTKMYQCAAEHNPKDPDVYTVLGVLFNLSRDYTQAEQAFQRALELDPGNYSLWNKLGATKANSHAADGSKQAVYAYRKALEIKPTYTRAWVNMGISYSNQCVYDTSAKYFLKALSLNPAAEHVWNYLRIALEYMGKSYLAERIEKRDVSAFRDEFQF